MNHKPWKLGVPQTIDGVEYVVVKFSGREGTLSAARRVYGEQQVPVKLNALISLLSCRACPFTPRCKGPGLVALCGSRHAGKSDRSRIVPLKLVPILALEGVLE